MESLPRSTETAEQRPFSERTRSQHRRSVETSEQTAARLSAQRDYARRQRSCETLEQAYRRRAANRRRSQRRRITETPDETSTACHCLYMYGVFCVLYQCRRRT